MTFFVILFIFALGIGLILRTNFFFSMTGAMEWPEKHIGPGGTRVFLKVIGIILIFIALFAWTGGLSDFGRAVLTPTIPE